MGEIKEITKPNEGIRSSARNSLLVAASSGLVVGLVGKFGGNSAGLVVGEIAGLVVGLFAGGGEAVIRHFTLRFC